MFEIIQKVYMVLLISIFNASNHRKSLSFSNQKCLIQPTLVSVHPNEQSQEFRYYPFSVKFDGCVGVVILGMIYIIKYVFQIKQKIEI